ncbi:MAG: saccharopine dehydrogenase NADP-binding domain-containing protein [Deltaproteobacteria bacterium]|nr:saccharopine dehydrogenase NADP-binding domain-containing protein [Deltaproteobacteria bacterium]MCW5800853.1 saccharopine dehydrogenase NADP-binding domain-containing protein [Deltaproteobacteria bacterium]
MTPDLDLVLFGATGYTGRLVAEYLATASKREPLRWAIAGRSRDKLETLRRSLAAPVDMIVVDVLDGAAVGAIARRTRAVCTTAGPFAKYGGALLGACAEAGTHYCDLTGELQWVRRMIDTHHERARATGARIVNSCGFDSIPSDLGTWAVQQEFIARHGIPADEVTALYGETSGGMSGGTVASGLQTATEADHDREVRRLLANPHALDPDPDAIPDPVRDEAAIGWNRDLKMFTIPFFMAGFNTRIVRRGHALAGFPWGRDFRYREVMSTPASARGLAMAVGFTGGMAALAFAVKRPWLRDQLAKRAPQPGEGPTPEERARGHWKVRFVARRDDHRLRYEAGDRADPGYGSTAKMLGESALCLALDPLDSPGGVVTPSVAMGGRLLDRLRRAGLTFAPAG